MQCRLLSFLRFDIQKVLPDSVFDFYKSMIKTNVF